MQYIEIQEYEIHILKWRLKDSSMARGVIVNLISITSAMNSRNNDSYSIVKI